MTDTISNIRIRTNRKGGHMAGIAEQQENKSLLSNDKRDQTPKPQLESCCPLATPFERRLQTLAVAWHTSSFVLFSIFALFAISTPTLWVFVIPYMTYFFFDRSPATGDVVNRYSLQFRSLPIWRWYCDYFPITLIKTVEMKPTFTLSKNKSNNEKVYKIRLWPTKYSINVKSNSTIDYRDQECTGPTYLFGYHPHGVGALGAFGAFATEGCNYSKTFPGIPISLMTLVTQFHIPLYRDYLLALGISSVSRKNALRTLSKNQSICIVVGGARESLVSSTNDTQLILNKRKGFIKLAIQTGNINLVPVFAFGEVNSYNVLNTDKDSALGKMQLWFKENFGFTIPIFYARGVFNYDFGLLPFRTPINVVVGRPIYVEKQIANPPDDVVNHFHDLYIEELERLYYENREKYGVSDAEFKIVG
ncbi:dga1p [Saccharomyces arboricola H-6]|uniref:Diacylglycerol O-acyltransferase n=1 Tax=Saccharomyces arboricola (strain H-6 / AS 2.3317 / CBS 10644) TaxID=1160507 RepID=J8PHL8_SACAR|nr:dga1p [Saccharomyces arboricola H-6]